MRIPTLLRAAAATIAVLFTGAPVGAPQAAQAQGKTASVKTYTVTLDAEKDYFAPDWVRVLAVSRTAGEVEVGKFDVTIRRTRMIAVPGDAGELIFRTTKNVIARLKLAADKGAITVRPLSDKGASAGLGWMFGRGGGVELQRLVVEFAGQ